MLKRAYGVCVVGSLVLALTTAAVGLLYVWMPALLPASLTAGVMVTWMSIALLVAGVMAHWAWLDSGKMYVLLLGLVLLLMAGTTYMNGVPTLPKYGRWPAEQIALQTLWSTLLLGMYALMMKSLHKSAKAQ